MDYLQYKGALASIKTEDKKQEKSARIKKRIRKIRWPRNFDPFKSNQVLPDPERWLPKLERKMYAKLAKKQGLLSKTQGTTSNVSQSQTKNTFQQGPSTATQDTAGAKKKLQKGRRKK